MNESSREVGESNAFTALLRDAIEEYWPVLREALREQGVDPIHAAVGDIWSDQGGPTLTVVTRDGRAAVMRTRYDPFEGPEYEVEATEWLETAAERSNEWTAIFAALRVLNAESPAPVEAIRVLAEGIDLITRNMREDLDADWSRFRSFLIEHGIDWTHCVLLPWNDAPRRDGPTERAGTILYRGRWFTFTVSLDPRLGSVEEVLAWIQTDEAGVRAARGAEVDAALEVAAQG